ncbi:MAG: hypothetical protein WB626_06175, partial [Bacteroidota bacterium]
MKKGLWFLALLLCPIMALGGGRKEAATRVMKDVPVPEQVVPEMKADPGRLPQYRGMSPSAGVYTTLGGWWDYQSNGAVEFLEMDSTTGWLHAIMIIATDSSNQSATRRTAYARSTDGGVTWDNFSSINVPSSRSGYPSLSILQGTTLPGAPVIANHITDPNTNEIVSSVHVGDTTAAPFGFSQLSDLPDNLPDQNIWPIVCGSADGSILLQASFNDITAGRLNHSVKIPDYLNWGAWSEVPIVD